MATPREFLFPSFKTGRLRRFAQRGLPLPAPIQGRKRCKYFIIPDERIRILPHPTPRFAREDGAQDTSMLAQFRLPPNYIFYPAQFWSHKNHVRILRAILHLKQKYNLCLPVVFTGFNQGNESYIPATRANAAAGRSGIFSRSRFASGVAGVVSKRPRSLLFEFSRALEFTATGSIRIGLSRGRRRYTRHKRTVR